MLPAGPRALACGGGPDADRDWPRSEGAPRRVVAGAPTSLGRCCNPSCRSMMPAKLVEGMQRTEVRVDERDVVQPVGAAGSLRGRWLPARFPSGGGRPRPIEGARIQDGVPVGRHRRGVRSRRHNRVAGCCRRLLRAGRGPTQSLRERDHPEGSGRARDRSPGARHHAHRGWFRDRLRGPIRGAFAHPRGGPIPPRGGDARALHHPPESRHRHHAAHHRFGDRWSGGRARSPGHAREPVRGDADHPLTSGPAGRLCPVWRARRRGSSPT